MKVNVKSGPVTYNTDTTAFNTATLTTSGNKRPKIKPQSPPGRLKCAPLEGQRR
jgi:hypothetical protein